MRTRHPNIWLIGLASLVLGSIVIHYRLEAQRESRAKVEISDLQIGLEHFRAYDGHYPSTEEGLGTLFGPVEMDSGFVRGMAKPQKSPLDHGDTASFTKAMARTTSSAHSVRTRATIRIRPCWSSTQSDMAETYPFVAARRRDKS